MFNEPELYDRFMENVKDYMLDKIHFDMYKYSEFYIYYDVEILRRGFNQFRKNMMQPPISIDIFKYLTLPSIANEWFNNNVFRKINDYADDSKERLYEFTGPIKDFIMKCCNGGRTMTNSNKCWKYTGKMYDFDACSLYPSAMNRMFIPLGLPIVYKPKDLEYNKDKLPGLIKHSFTIDQTKPTKERFYSYYMVRIQITKIGKQRQFPLIYKRDNAGIHYVNECVEMYVDQTYLEDLIEFQDISFKILEGYMWKASRNTKYIRESIELLYNKRLEYKKIGSSLQRMFQTHYEFWLW
jgi:hypothetical protein